MPRPKKSPRVRLQIVLPKDADTQLRAYCKRRELDKSQVAAWALRYYIKAMENSEKESPLSTVIEHA